MLKCEEREGRAEDAVARHFRHISSSRRPPLPFSATPVCRQVGNGTLLKVDRGISVMH